MKKKTAMEAVYLVNGKFRHRLWSLGKDIIKELKKEFIKNKIPIWRTDKNVPTDEWKLSVLALEELSDVSFPMCFQDSFISCNESIKFNRRKDKKLKS
jgi:hypothetical protein